MTIRLYGILTDGLNKPIVNATVSLIARSNTLIVLGSSEAIFRTDSQGAYNITMNPGHYVVIVGPQGKEPYKAGEIVLYADSPDGSLNGYLVNWVEEELTPDVIKQVQQLVTNSEEYALQAGRSAAAANADATDARNSKASAAQSASDALVYKNDAKASEDAARQAQAGAAGSANTASQAVTTIQGLKSDVEQLKVDTQGIKDSAVSETQVIKDAAAASAAQASNSATEAGQQASNAAGSAQSASADAGRAEVAAGKAEDIVGKSLLKENNLSDLSNIEIARRNMRVGPFDTDGNHSFIFSPDRSYRLVIRNDGLLVYQTGDGTETKPFEIGAGGTGATNAADARTNLGLNRIIQIPEETRIVSPGGERFLIVKDDGFGLWDKKAGPIPLEVLYGGTGAKDAAGARNNLGLGTAQDVQFKSITATDGHILVPQTRIIGCKTDNGGDKNIFLMNVGGDSSPGGWVNLLQGNWYEGYWQFGGVRDDGKDLRHAQLYISPNKSGYSGISFNFIPEPTDTQASGYIRSPRGFMGRCYMGGWPDTASNRITPFWADTVTRNNSGWSPIVSGGSMSDGGYYMRTSLGTISNGTTAWPDAVIQLLGDGSYTRAFHFGASGGLHTWTSYDGWGAGYDFAKNPTSDRDLKKEIVYTDGKESYDRVMQWLPTMFKYKWSETQRFGLIAQDMTKIDPQYVKIVPGAPIFEEVVGVNEDGEEYVDHLIETGFHDDTLALDSNVMLTDLSCAFVYQSKKVEKLETELAELKAIVAKLANLPETLPIDSNMP